jgi:hypothetical protein
MTHKITLRTTLSTYDLSSIIKVLFVIISFLYRTKRNKFLYFFNLFQGSGSSSSSGGKPAGMAALAASYKSNLSTPVVAPKVVAPPNSKLFSVDVRRLAVTTLFYFAQAEM